MPYFFGERDGGLVTITGVDARHLTLSLRARPGEVISVVEPEGRLLEVRLQLVGKARVVGEVIAERPHRPEPPVDVTVALAVLPAVALEDAFAHCTEAGARGFLLVEAERSVARAGSLSPGKRERWGRICREAAMLAGRLRVPEVSGPEPLGPSLAQCVNPVLLDRSGTQGLEALRGCSELTLFVGPEGGWTRAERALVDGARLLSLGPRNLRAETAAIVGLAAALAAVGGSLDPS